MGMSGDTALTLAKNYVKKTLQGQGALKGQDGFSPIVTENKDNTDEIYKLDITTKDGTFTTPNLKGFIGSDGFSPIATVTKVGNTTTITLTDKNGTTSEMIMGGETNVIESVTVNGVAVPISDKTVNIDLSGYVEKEDGKTLVSASDVSQIRKNKDDIATLNGTGDGSVDKKIADKLSEQTYLTKKIITADEARAYIADPHTAKFNIIYLVKDESASGSDKYFEYQRIGTEESSTFEMTGDTSTDLSDYAKITDVNTELDKKEKQIIDLKMLGWTVPIECPIQNYVDSDGVFHQRVGRVEISNIVANESMFGTNFRLVPPTDCKKESYLNGYCKLYQTVDSADYDGWNTYRDNKSIGFLSTYDFIIVKDDTYADETAFKNAMKGVYLYYELATEKTIIIDGNESTQLIRNSISNPNLLDNAWFSVNQRGVTKIEDTAAWVYGADRWKFLTGKGTEFGDGYVLLASVVLQVIDDNVYNAMINAKKYTFSILDGDGNIETVTGSGSAFKGTVGGYTVEFPAEGYGQGKCIAIYNENDSAKAINAIKLELGSVSTLANEVKPDYEMELAKCRVSKADTSDTYANKKMAVIDDSGITSLTSTLSAKAISDNFNYSTGTVTLNSNVNSYVGYEKYGRLVHIKGLFVVNTAISKDDIIITLPFESVTTHGIFLRDKTGSATQCAFVTTGIKVVDTTLPVGVYDIDTWYIEK